MMITAFRTAWYILFGLALCEDSYAADDGRPPKTGGRAGGAVLQNQWIRDGKWQLNLYDPNLN